jgi:hypothetical protein
MNVIKRLVVCLLAILLACLNGDAQQPIPAFRFKSLIASGAKIGHYTLNADTDIDGIAINGNGDLAFSVSHLRLADSFGSAVLTPERVVATSLDHVGTKILLDIFAPSLALDDLGHVVFEASYKDGDAIRLGVFKEKEFQFIVNGPGAADDFSLSPDGRVLPKAGIVATAPPPTAPHASTGAAGRAFRQLGLNPTLLNELNRISPVVVPPNIVQTARGPQPSPPNPPQQVRPTAPPVQPAKPAPACALPVFPLPAEWSVTSDIKGPITSSVFDAPNGKPRTYESQLFGHMPTPFRDIFYTSDCVVQMIVISDAVLHGKVEFWTPNGLLTYTALDGFLLLQGYAGKVPPGAIARRDLMLKINRRGQIAMPIVIDPDGYAIVLATPIPGR